MSRRRNSKGEKKMDFLKEVENTPLPEPPRRRIFWFYIPRLIILAIRYKAVMLIRILFLAKWRRFLYPLKSVHPGFKRELYMTVSQAAQSLYYSESSIRRFIHTGKLNAFMKNGRFYITSEDLEKFRYEQNR
jgi:hypothetical protein